MLKRILGFWLLLGAVGLLWGQYPLQLGRVLRVVDGDTVVVSFSGENRRIRLMGIDAPEMDQAMGIEAKEELSRILLGRVVACSILGEDRYERLLADIFVDRLWVNERMVVLGWAHHAYMYDNRDSLKRAEQNAREKRAGIWSLPTVVMPWDHRRIR